MSDRSMPLTAAGISVLALGIGGYVGGWQLGWVELMVLAAGCGLALLLAAPWVIGRMRLDVLRTLEPARVMVGEPSLAVLDVTNPGRSRIRGRVVEDQVGRDVVEVEVPSLASGATHQQVYRLPTERRGAVRVGPAVISRQDPLQLVRRQVRQADAETLFVHPRHRAVASLPVGYAKDLEGPTSETSPAGDVAFHALREYQPGDDYRHIHWLSTARTGTAMVRHYVDNRRPQLLVLLDERSSVANTDQFEVAVEIAASFAVSSFLHQQPVAVWSTTGPILGRARPGGRDDLLDQLSVVEQGTGGDPGRTALHGLRTEAGTSAVILVTGSAAAEQLVGFASQVRRRARVIIVRVWPAGEVQAGVVPGARVLDVDSLDRFCRAWQSVAR